MHRVCGGSALDIIEILVAVNTLTQVSAPNFDNVVEDLEFVSMGTFSNTGSAQVQVPLLVNPQDLPLNLMIRSGMPECYFLDLVPGIKYEDRAEGPTFSPSVLPSLAPSSPPFLAPGSESSDPPSALPTSAPSQLPSGSPSNVEEKEKLVCPIESYGGCALKGRENGTGVEVCFINKRGRLKKARMDPFAPLKGDKVLVGCGSNCSPLEGSNAIV
jgi:hypothetical protein